MAGKRNERAGKRKTEKEKEKLKSKPFTKKKNYELWKRQQQNCTCVWFEQMNSNSMKETKKNWQKKKKRFGTCNCARINRHKFSEQTNTQIHVRHIVHTTIHPIVIKSKQTTARLAANSITNNIWCASVRLLLKWLNMITRMTLQASKAKQKKECVLYFSKFPFVSFRLNKNHLCCRTHLFIYFILFWLLCV